MKLNRNEVRDVVLSNDIATAVEMLEGFGFNVAGLTDKYSSASKELAACMLCTMSVAAMHDKLTDEFAQEIINRVGSFVSVFDLIRMVIIGANIRVNDLGCLPSDVLWAVFYSDFSDDTVEKIGTLGVAEFESLLVLFTGIIRMPKIVGLELLRKIHEYSLIPRSQFYALMAAYLYPPSNDSSAFPPGLFAVIDALGFFGSPLSPDDEGEQKHDKETDKI